MKYFVYLNNKDNDSIVKQSFLMSKNLHSGYFSNFINMFEQYNLTSLDTEPLDNGKIRRYTTEMREKYLIYLFGGTALKIQKIKNFIKLLNMNIFHLIISTS